jgi:TRAP-type C4-dicarboxylate transport system permease small subunit
VFERISAVAVAAVAVFVSLSAILRYFLGAPLAFSDELVGFLLCCGLFLAIPALGVDARHVSITGIVERLPTTVRLVVRRIARLITAGFAVLFGMAILPELQFNIDFGVKSEIGRIPLWPWVAVLPASMAVMAIIELIAAIRPTAFGSGAEDTSHGASEPSADTTDEP